MRLALLAPRPLRKPLLPGTLARYDQAVMRRALALTALSFLFTCSAVAQDDPAPDPPDGPVSIPKSDPNSRNELMRRNREKQQRAKDRLDRLNLERREASRKRLDHANREQQAGAAMLQQRRDHKRRRRLIVWICVAVALFCCGGFGLFRMKKSNQSGGETG